MASVYALTTPQMHEPMKQALYDALCDALGHTFAAYSLMLQDIPAHQCSRSARNSMVVFVCVPPYMEAARRRELAADLYQRIGAVFPLSSPGGLTVLFPEHPDDCCGKHGVMRSDAAAQ